MYRTPCATASTHHVPTFAVMPAALLYLKNSIDEIKKVQRDMGTTPIKNE